MGTAAVAAAGGRGLRGGRAERTTANGRSVRRRIIDVVQPAGRAEIGSADEPLHRNQRLRDVVPARRVEAGIQRGGG